MSRDCPLKVIAALERKEKLKERLVFSRSSQQLQSLALQPERLFPLLIDDFSKPNKSVKCKQAKVAVGWPCSSKDISNKT